jgi:hypothetical protein
MKLAIDTQSVLGSAWCDSSAGRLSVLVQDFE